MTPQQQADELLAEYQKARRERREERKRYAMWLKQTFNWPDDRLFTVIENEACRTD